MCVKVGELQQLSNVISDLLPLSYAIDATKQVITDSVTPAFWRNILIVAGFAAAALIGGAATLRRRTP